VSALAPGSQLGGYRIDAIAGSGGMGVVYRATQARLGRAVALKVIAPGLAEDEDFRRRFERESRLAASIEHPNVLPIYEAGEADGVLFLSMRYVDGTDLRSMLKREGRLEPRRATEIVAQVAEALDAAHRAGLVHRDVKPGNILIADGDHAYLTDFGLTKRAASESALTSTGEFVGTVDYVAPEQVAGGRVDARTDVYALACVLYHLLTGRVPYERPSEMARLYAHVNEPPPVPSAAEPAVPRELDAVVARGMAKDPADRYQSAGDLGRGARAGADSRRIAEPEHSVARGDAAPSAPGAAPTVAAPGAPRAQAGARGRRVRIWALAAGVVVAAGVVAAVIAGGGGGGGSSSSIPPGGQSTVLNNVPPPVRGERVVAAAQTHVKGVAYRLVLSTPRTKGPRRAGVPLYMNEYVGQPAPLHKLHRLRLPFPYARDSYVASLKVEANPDPNPDKTAGVALSWFLHVGDKTDLTHYFGLTLHGIDVY
jgi:predicted Ser/Thr protein kinase